MKKIIRLTEGDLHRIVKNSVKRIMKEDIDMGQVPSYQDRMDSINYKNRIRETPQYKELEHRIRVLRNIMDDVEEQFGVDAADGITLKIKELHKEMEKFWN